MQLFLDAFKQVPDPRAKNTRYDLAEILMVAFVAVLSGAQNCCEMVAFGNAKIKFFKRFLNLTHGIPSHDTLSAVLRMIDPKALDASFANLTSTLINKLGKAGVIAIDGKALKGAHDKGKAHAPRMMVSAYATGLRMTLATLEAENGNEVDAALEVLGLIDLKGKIVTGDALHCNRRMVATIIAAGGDYCLALKENQASLLSDARSYLSKARKPQVKAVVESKGHGRVERREARITSAKGLAKHHDFPGLKAVGEVVSTREIDGKIETDVRVFALSCKLSPEQFLGSVRAHWQIENALHWQLDVSFREDAARTRRDNGPANIAVLRRRALDVARRDKSKGSLTEKLKRAGWNHELLLKMLSHMR